MAGNQVVGSVNRIHVIVSCVQIEGMSSIDVSANVSLANVPRTCSPGMLPDGTGIFTGQLGLQRRLRRSLQ